MTDDVRAVDGAGETAPRQRLDKWLWYTRTVKTRTLATRLVTAGKVRVNREKVDKASHAVQVGDVVTLTVNRRLRVLKVLRPGERRGPATEARALYEDLTPPEVQPGEADPATPSPAARREPGQGRPTKRERRHLDRFRNQS